MVITALKESVEMTTKVDIVNRALQNMGTRTTVTAAELVAQSTNEAIQAELIYDNCRDDLSRMAPWNCTMKTADLVYITSMPGTPENTSPPTLRWVPGQPSPPWLYEYQYPEDCLRPQSIVPTTATGSGINPPISTATTGAAAGYWQGPPVLYKVAVDQFYPVTAAAVAAGGTGYVVKDTITLAYGADGAVPIGAPVVLRVLTIGALGAVATVEVVNQIPDSVPPAGGSYFRPQPNPQPQGTTSGFGAGATFNLTYGDPGDQRVILTNQEFAILKYSKRVIDTNVWDTLFQSAFVDSLAAQLTMALTGDKGLANALFKLANISIAEARKADANEGLTINDVTPDWVRARGIYGGYGNGNTFGTSFDWGGLWPTY
jgi:hypothetical protein